MNENKQKIKNLILYFANETTFMGKKKLAKLMYFVDFTYFELTGESVTGMKYEKEKYGPLPMTFYENLRVVEGEGLIAINETPATHFIEAKGKADLSVFSEKELEVIMSVTRRYKDIDAKTLEVQAQSEPPYLMVSRGEEIPYHLAYYRNSFDEITLEDEVTTPQ